MASRTELGQINAEDIADASGKKPAHEASLDSGTPDESPFTH